MVKPKVSIIIPTKNERESLPKLLKSLAKQTFKNFETIVVDNFSTDKTVEIAKKFTKKVYLKGPERSSQRNFGAIKAAGDYLLFLDADMELVPHLLAELANLTKMGVKAAIIPEISKGASFWAKSRAFERKFYFNSDIEAQRFFEKKLFEKIGGYNKALIAAEDWDLALRIKKNDVKIWRTKNQIIHHEGNLSLLNQIRKKFYYGQNLPEFAKLHPKFFIVKSNLVFRPEFLKKAHQLLLNPKLTFGIIILKLAETLAFGAGFFKAKLSKWAYQKFQ